MKPVVLVVDDEAQMVSIVTFAFESLGNRALPATNGRQAWQILENRDGGGYRHPRYHCPPGYDGL